MKKKILLIYLCGLALTDARGGSATPPQTAPLKQNFWSISASGLRYVPQSEGSLLEGFGGQLSLGYGKIWEKSLAILSMDMKLGPYGVHHKEANLDFEGLGLEFLFASSRKPLRTASMCYGWLTGFAYSYQRGKSLGPFTFHSTESHADSDLDRLDSLSTTAQDGSIIYGIFLSQILTARSDLKTPETSKSRFEGGMLSFAITIPISSSISSSSLRVNEGGLSYKEHTRSDHRHDLRFLLTARLLLGS
ncbi:MAG: hypothetical protein KA436_04710 [Oligoflexales bacterium]|nr:hypothetical protein [Oligoflexales bacterium]